MIKWGLIGILFLIFPVPVLVIAGLVFLVKAFAGAFK